MSNFTKSIVNICSAELELFDGGRFPEEDANFYKRIGEYWQSISINEIDGRTQVKDSKGKYYNPAWSAAFVSFIAKEAGAGNGFHYTQAHCHYIEHARKDAINRMINVAYYAVDPYAEAPGVGDIICAGREYAKNYSFIQAELAYKADGFYPSHGDYVVEVNSDKGYVRTIGGNVGSSVREKRLNIDANGRLLDLSVGHTTYPWLALLRCRI